MSVTAHDLTVVMLTVLAVAALLIGSFYLRADYEVDRFRQQVFRLRDELFDFADAEAVSFDAVAYVRLRALLNALIRFAHRLTFWRILALFSLDLLFDVQPTASFLAEFEASLEALPSEEIRGTLRGFHARAGQLIRVQLLRSSILLWPVLLVDSSADDVYRNARIARSEIGVPTTWIEQQALLSS